MIISFKPIQANYFGIGETYDGNKFVLYLARVYGKNLSKKKIIATVVADKERIRSIGEALLKLAGPSEE